MHTKRQSSTQTHLACITTIFGTFEIFEFITLCCVSQNLCLNSVNHLTCKVNVSPTVEHKTARTHTFIWTAHSKNEGTGGEMTVSNEKWYRFQVCVSLLLLCFLYGIPLFPVHIKEFNLLFIKKFCVTNQNFILYYNEMSVINVWEFVTIQLYDRFVMHRARECFTLHALTAMCMTLFWKIGKSW